MPNDTLLEHFRKNAIEQRYGHPMFHTLIEEIRELHEKKNRQYATPEDPLGNFRRTGKIIAKMLKPGLDPTLASCLAFMSKQVDGVYEIFGEAKTDTIDSLEDKLLDIAVYSIIAMIMVREARGLKLTNEYRATWGEPPLPVIPERMRGNNLLAPEAREVIQNAPYVPDNRLDPEYPF
jgi:hypothetical protein